MDGPGHDDALRPLPETLEALEELGGAMGGDLQRMLDTMVERVRTVVPDLVGLSLALVEHGLTFTVVASDELMAELDALQYVDGGPCVEAGKDLQLIDIPDVSALSEERWQLFALGTAHAHIGSTLTLPMRRGGDVTGTVNLYAASRGAFEHHHEELAELLGAWAPGAVTNADLGFETLAAARDAPDQVGASLDFALAVDLMMRLLELDAESAERRLVDAARRAGISPLRLATALVELGRAAADD